MKIVIVSGGFDPIHSGHIALFREAAGLGDKLIVGINSDEWLTRKKGKPFMPLKERLAVLESIKWIDEVWQFDDSDDTARELIERVSSHYRKVMPVYIPLEIIFANGGDRNEDNNAEKSVQGVKFVYGVGGNDKKNSSSWLLGRWNE
jgi:D-beta-D-heptose 7-phosphate kinase/D-beta-D-heptose 1-phosphate adenosyltransferase